MKRLVVLLSCMVGALYSFSQVGGPKFAADINAAKTDSQKAAVYAHAIVYYNDRNADSFKHYAEKGLSYFTGKGSKIGEGRSLPSLACSIRYKGASEARQNACRWHSICTGLRITQEV